MNITLIFPPHWAPYQPYLSLPVLTSVLRHKGYSVTQRDVNIEFVDYILSTHFLKKTFGKILARIDYLTSLSERNDKEDLELKQLSVWKDCGPEIIRLVKGSKDLMKSKSKFFDFDVYREACLVLLKSYHMVGDSYFPTMMDFYSLELKYSRYSTKGIMDCIEDKESNIYYDYYEKNILPSLIENPSDFYGISISAFSQTIPGITLAGMIKKALPKSHVCIGGNVFTRVGPRLLPSSPLFEFFDSIIMYEGEVALLSLLNALEKGEDLSSVSNIIYKDKNEKLILNEKVETPDIHNLPYPDFNGLPLSLYLSPSPVIPLLSARGCYWNKCAFCQHKYTYRGGYRIRTIKSVVDELEYLSKSNNCTYFSFNDEAVSPVRLRDISLEIIKRGLNIRWEAYARVEKKLDKDIASLLYKAGCRMLSFGLESSSPRVLKLMSKGLDVEVFEEVLSNSAITGIWNYAWFFTGFPSETEEEAMGTCDFILKNQDKLHSVSLDAVFGLEEYTDIALNPDKYYLKNVKPVESNDLSFVYNYTIEHGLSTEEATGVAGKIKEKILTNHRQAIIMATMPRVHQMVYSDYFKTNDLAGAIYGNSSCRNT